MSSRNIHYFFLPSLCQIILTIPFPMSFNSTMKALAFHFTIFFGLLLLLLLILEIYYLFRSLGFLSFYFRLDLALSLEQSISIKFASIFFFRRIFLAIWSFSIRPVKEHSFDLTHSQVAIGQIH